jgi:hypothetical protein
LPNLGLIKRTRNPKTGGYGQQPKFATKPVELASSSLGEDREMAVTILRSANNAIQRVIDKLETAGDRQAGEAAATAKCGARGAIAESW